MAIHQVKKLLMIASGLPMENIFSQDHCNSTNIDKAFQTITLIVYNNKEQLFKLNYFCIVIE